MFPHEYLEAYVTEIVGRRVDLLGPLKQALLMPIVVGLSDQLSAYADCRPGTRFTCDDVQLREGTERAYLLASLRDHGRPLRLQGTLAGWQPRLTSSRPEDFVDMHVARRWRFVEKNRRLIERLFSLMADAIATYYARKPYAKLCSEGMPRLLEGVDRTYLAIELDDRGQRDSRDQPGRYAVA